MKALAVLAVALLSGCVATMPQQAARPTSASDPSNNCLTSMQSDERIQILAQKINLSGPNSSIEMMASKDVPTEEEKKALSTWALARQACVDLGRDYRARYGAPGWANVIEWQQSAVLEAIAGLYGGSLTYGQFNVERTRVATAVNAKARDVADRNSSLRAQQAQQDAAASARELREYQERNDATMQMLIQQTQTNKPIRTDCNRFGTSVNCTTR